ncbi:hypothetical protein [Crossiella cryophila]|uniref:Crotonobetainyl-CoA:carnitine CoA-transferase CaiB-like acyl-CoA transferase n=1 Tax=Crossiella cryophila TaxID=43355 RepID=A0A7W7CFP7_9PSEU|nr:hypothetical protein [Crossiella cryophila]MBB4680380.1 crotonobetainyl-CoA:carnitine CoA-transferase CaiB-like acyl-CoA transferase [Crossiella cryophila]
MTGHPESAVTAVRAALTAVEAELDRWRSGRGTVGSESQLDGFQRMLRQMLTHLEANRPTGNHYPGMGRVVTDSWPFNTELGELVVTAERAFREAGTGTP